MQGFDGVLGDDLPQQLLVLLESSFAFQWQLIDLVKNDNDLAVICELVERASRSITAVEAFRILRRRRTVLEQELYV